MRISSRQATRLKKKPTTERATAIFVLTPQAKGRIERLFGVLQDRLIAELELWNITGITGANRFLMQRFIEE